MNWKLFPRNVGYVLDGKKVDFYICEKGIVLEEQYVNDGEPAMEKAIKPLILRNRSYIRIRRAGIDKKFQLAMIFMELFPELTGNDLVIETRKGAWSITEELKRLKGGKGSSEEAAPEAEEDEDRLAPQEPLAEFEEDMASSEEEPADLQEPAAEREDTARRVCKICDVRKTIADFNHKQEICDDCFFDRKELMKEIVMKRRQVYEAGHDSSRRRV